MGLDMYLTRRTYVKQWAHQKPEERHEVTVTRGGKPRPDIQPARIKEIIEEVAYWRKANAIHAWFVKHVQSGEDDCGTYYVGREQLEQLKAECDKVLKVSKLKAGKVKEGATLEPGGKWR